MKDPIKTKQALLNAGKILTDFLKKEEALRLKAKKTLEAAIKNAEGKQADMLRQKINEL